MRLGLCNNLVGNGGSIKIPLVGAVAFMGDSITTQIGSDIVYANSGAWSWFSSGANQRPTIVRNGNTPYFATSGFRTDQIISTYLSLVCSSAADTIITMAGTNDVIQSIAENTIVANLNTIKSAVIAAGKTPVFCEILPTRTGGTYVSKAANIASLNARIRQLADSKTIVVRWASAMEVVAGTGLGDTAYYKNTDDIHPDADGMVRLVAIMSSTLQKNIVRRDDYADTVWVTPNPLLSGSGGIPTGWTAEGFSGTTVGTQVLTPRGGDLGNWWTVPVANAVGGSANAQVRYGYGTPGTGFVAGDVIEFVGEFELSDADAFAKIRPRLTIQPSSVNYDFFGSSGGETITGGLHPSSGVWKTPPITIPVGNTGIWPVIALVGNGTWKFGRIGARKIS